MITRQETLKGTLCVNFLLLISVSTASFSCLGGDKDSFFLSKKIKHLHSSEKKANNKVMEA